MDNLILVNKTNSIDKMYVPDDLVICDNNENNFHEYIDPNLKPMIKKEVFDNFQTLHYDALKDGLNIIIDSGFRSADYQEKIWLFNSQENYKKLKEEYPNLSEKELLLKEKILTSNYVALPGHSEHQTGLAIDFAIMRNNEIIFNVDNTDESNWMLLNAYKYGFILRYPDGKENLTGYSFEPWHYRYIGYPHSYECFKSDLILEEYVLKLKK